MYKVGIFGFTGRFGKILVKMVGLDRRFTLASCVYSREGASLNSLPPEFPGVEASTDLSSLLACDVIIDFSHFAGSGRLSEFLLESKYSGVLVVGTTALPEPVYDVLRQIARNGRVAVLSNCTIGVITMRRLIADALKIIPSADVEIVEKHHAMKLDSPSGTALSLAKVVAKEKGLDVDRSLVYGRCGCDTKRDKGEIGVFAIRGGSVNGEHSVLLFYGDETLEVKHTASSKDCFAKGALDIAYKLAMLSEPHFYDDGNIDSLLLG